MSYQIGRAESGRRCWRGKSITSLAVMALISGGMLSAPAAVAAPEISVASTPAVSAVSKPTLSGSVTAGSTVRANIVDLDQAMDWEVGWYLDGIWQDGESTWDDPFAFSIPLDAVGKNLTFEGWIWWEDGHQEVAVNAGTVLSRSFTTAPTPVITGRAAVGNIMTAHPGSWAPSGAEFKYQWIRGGQTIGGATKRTYALSSADLNQSVAVKVTASKVGYTTLSRTSAAQKVAAGSLKPTKAVKVTGTARYGSTLKVSTKWPSGAKATYQWFRGSSKIKGATKASYKLTKNDIGKTIKVSVTVTKAGYATYRTSAKSAKVGKASFSLKAAPKITGTKKAGHALKVSKGKFSATPSSYSYQWYRGSAKIKGATQSSYRLSKSDVGKKIAARVTVKRSNYLTKTIASASVSIPSPPRTVIWRDGTYKVGSGIKPGLYKATGTGSGCYWETLNGFSGSFKNINNNYFGSANTYVRIKSSDRGFSTRGCGKWSTISNSGANSSKITKDGTYRVGIDVKAGTYVSNGKGNSCYWATLDDFTEDFDDLRDNYFGSARTIVEIPKSAAGFQVRGCGTLVRE